MTETLRSLSIFTRRGNGIFDREIFVSRTFFFFIYRFVQIKDLLGRDIVICSLSVSTALENCQLTVTDAC